jgi:aminomethyltransferase
MADVLQEIEAGLKKLRTTALNAVHRTHKAKMVDFGGWDMPVEYSGLIAEHMAVRTGVGLFDVSHMGDIQLRGPGSLAAVQRLLMNDASRLQAGQAHYSAMLYEDGTFVDDVVLHKLSDNDYLIVINAGTREKDVQWVRKTIGFSPHQRFFRLLHAACDPGPEGGGDAAEADFDGSVRD